MSGTWRHVWLHQFRITQASCPWLRAPAMSSHAVVGLHSDFADTFQKTTVMLLFFFLYTFSKSGQKLNEMHGVVWLHGDCVQEEAAVMSNVGQGETVLSENRDLQLPHINHRVLPSSFLILQQLLWLLQISADVVTGSSKDGWGQFKEETG